MEDEDYLGLLQEKVSKLEPEYHELSTVFLSFEDTQEFDGLVESIRKYGLFDNILMWKGSIVDGRHRHKACLKAGVQPQYEYLPDDMPFNVVMDRVISSNLMRRHLTTGQRAMTAAALANMRQGGDRGNQYAPSQTANLRLAKTIQEAADQLSVSTRTVDTAKAISRDFPDLADSVKSGSMSLNAADEERKKRLGIPPKFSPPIVKIADLDEFMHIKGDNWSSEVAAGSLISTARDLHLQEGEDGIYRSIMNIMKLGEGKHSQSYNAAGLISLHKALSRCVPDLEKMLIVKADTTKMN